MNIILQKEQRHSAIALHTHRLNLGNRRLRLDTHLFSLFTYHLANYGARLSNFELDFDDSEIRCRTSTDVSGDTRKPYGLRFECGPPRRGGAAPLECPNVKA
ncbi:MAG: hypothetical protein ACFB8W_10970 [Elainellaceae cyanobacterium]